MLSTFTEKKLRGLECSMGDCRQVTIIAQEKPCGLVMQGDIDRRHRLTDASDATVNVNSDFSLRVSYHDLMPSV